VRRKTIYLYNAVAVLLGLVLGILLGEGLVRTFAPDWLEHRMEYLRAAGQQVGNDTDLAWSAESVDGQILRFTPWSRFAMATGEYRNAVNIDGFGGRSTCASFPRNALSRTIAVLGDSFTFGVGVEDCDTFSSLLALGRPDVNVLNLGVAGTALPQQLFIAERRSNEFPAATLYVFSFYLGNDFGDMLSLRPFWWEAGAQAGGASRESERRKGKRVLEYLNGLSAQVPLRFSYLVQFLRGMALRLYLGGEATSVDAVFKVMSSSNLQVLDSSRAALREALARMKSFAERRNVQVLVVAIPDRYQVIEPLRTLRAEYYGFDIKALDPLLPNRILAEETARSGIPLIDPTGCMDKRADKGNLYYTNDNHLTKAGHAAFFQCLEPPLSRWLPGRQGN
jgi:hypothetical protein